MIAFMQAGGIALYGGTFNPVHIGHLVSARAIQEYLDLARVIFVPAGYPPHRWSHELASPQDRLEMVRRAIAGEPHFDVTDIELRQGGMTYSMRSIEGLRATLGPGVTLYWIIGGDMLTDLRNWQRIAEMAQVCRIVTAVRAGVAIPDLSALADVLAPDQIDRIRSLIVSTPAIDISSTEIRWRIREGRSIRFLVPDSVREFIEQRGLYKPPTR